MTEIEQTIKRAFHNDDAALVRETFAKHPELKSRINDPIGPFDSPLIISARSRAMLDALLDAGADIDARSRWWAGGFGLLDSASDDLAAYAIERGANLDIHSAARLGKLDRLADFIAKDPASVNSRGGDGKTPLHFARSIEVARFLLEHGADINVRDIDHESTPAQHLIEERPEVVRFLVAQGAETDIFIAAALGDIALAKKHLQQNPSCIRHRVDSAHFPMSNHRAGGTIYNWTLGWYVSPHQAAKKFGQQELFQWLMDQSPPDVKLLNAAWVGDLAAVEAIISKHPKAAKEIARTEKGQLAHAARNNDLPAVRAMLRAGLPTDGRGQLGATPLHWAAWHGNAEMAKLLIDHQAPLEILDVDNQATPLGWATHGSEHGWHRATGNYRATAEALLNAGAKTPPNPTGSAEIRKVLSDWQSKSSKK